MEAIKALFTYVPLAMISAGRIILLMTNLDKIYPAIVKDLEKRRSKKAV